MISKSTIGLLGSIVLGLGSIVADGVSQGGANRLMQMSAAGHFRSEFHEAPLPHITPPKRVGATRKKSNDLTILLPPPAGIIPAPILEKENFIFWVGGCAKVGNIFWLTLGAALLSHLTEKPKIGGREGSNPLPKLQNEEVKKGGGGFFLEPPPPRKSDPTGGGRSLSHASPFGSLLARSSSSCSQ